MEDERPFSVGRLILGSILGVFVGLGCLLASLMVTPVIGRYFLLIPALNALLLAGAAVFAITLAHDKGLARGMLISLSLVFLLNAICGVSMIRR